MQLNSNLFITPAIALVFVLWAYFHFRKKTSSRQIYHRCLTVMGLLAFFLNWIWEVAQGPLYKGFLFDIEHISFCGLASVADMLMVYSLLFGFGLIYQDVFWIKKLNLKRLFGLMFAGGVGAILAEMRHTSAGNWSYADAMPTLPWGESGFLPILQFTLLPTFIFLITNKIINFDHLKKGSIHLTVSFASMARNGMRP